MSKIEHTTQVFRATIQAPVILHEGETYTGTIKVWQQGDRTLTVGPLDMERFQDGDNVKIIVQRVGKRREERGKK